jgi:hypothetical protein
MQRKRTPRPPLRSCRDCGGDLYTWAVDPICPMCVVALKVSWATTESYRDWRKRVLESK